MIKAGAINAAILTAEILSLNNDTLVAKLQEFKDMHQMFPKVKQQIWGIAFHK